MRLRLRPPDRRITMLRVAALLTLLTLLGCVGASRTAGDYTEKAANTAEAARSAVATAHLLAGAAGEGKTPGRYTGRALSDVEGDLDSLATQFGAVQPPTGDASRLRHRLTSLLADCRAALAELRIAARRGELSELPELARPLPGLVDRLRVIEGLTAT